MKILIISILTILSLNSMASEVKTFEGTAKIKGVLKYYNDFTGAFLDDGKRTVTANAHAELIYKSWGEGKIKGSINIVKLNHCNQPKHIDFIGISNGMDSYDLYSNAEDILKGASFGEVSEYAKRVQVIIYNGIYINGVDANGNNCNFTINSSDVVSFKAKQ
jgi:hypothetical protein